MPYDQSISRERARTIAQEHLGGGEILGVHSHDEVGCAPSIFGGPRLDLCWIAYVAQPFRGVKSSIVVLVHRFTGEVLYVGSANDEG